MTPEAFHHFMGEFTQGWATQDLDRMVAVFAPDGAYADTPFSPPHVGRAAIRRYNEIILTQAEGQAGFAVLTFDPATNTGVANWWIEYRVEIGDVVVRFATALDRHDWVLYRSCFTPEIEADLSSLLGVPPRRATADEWTAFVASEQSGFSATQHISSNHVITVRDDEATCVAYLHAQHCFPHGTSDGTCCVGGRYTYQLARTAEGWLIRAYALEMLWSEGNQAVFELARRQLSPAPGAEPAPRACAS